MSASTYPSVAEWTLSDTIQAADEGWGIFDADGSENGRTQLQAMDEAPMCATDDDAWKFVTMKARAGSAFHRRALEIVARHNPGEAKSIRDLTGYGEA